MRLSTLLGLFLLAVPMSAYCLEIGLSAEPMHLGMTPKSSQKYNLYISLNDVKLAVTKNNANLANPLRELTLSIPDKPDWDGLKQDTELFMLYQIGIVGVIYFLPESTSQWGDEEKSGNPFHKWRDNVSNLRKDKDDWAINYIGHPYFGATYYVRARNRGFDRKGSFWYAVTMSAIYEYGIEAIFEPASIQDLIFTPVGGAIIGEYFMIGRQKIINRITATGKQSTWDTLGLFFTDPIGVINKKVTGYFSHSSQIQLELQPVLMPTVLANNTSTQNNDRYSSPAYTSSLYGIQAQLTW